MLTSCGSRRSLLKQSHNNKNIIRLKQAEQFVANTRDTQRLACFGRQPALCLLHSRTKPARVNNIGATGGKTDAGFANNRGTNTKGYEGRDDSRDICYKTWQEKERVS